MKEELPSLHRKKLPSMRSATHRHEDAGLPKFRGGGEKKRKGLRKLAHAATHGSKHNVFGKIHNALSRPLTHPRRTLPVIGGTIGTIFGGPFGGIIGGGIGGGLSGKRGSDGKVHAFQNMMKGAGTGALISGGANILGGGGLPLFGGSNPISPSTPSGPSTPGGGFFSGMMDKLGGFFGGGKEGDTTAPKSGGLPSLGTMANFALPAMAIIGTMKRKVKTPKDEYSPEQIRDKFRDNRPLRKLKPIHQQQVPLPEDWSAETHGEHHWYDSDMPFSTEYEDGAPAYREGGKKFTGDHGGTSDTRDAKVSDGEYVMNSTSVSLLGDGNTQAGFKVLETLEKNLRKHKGLNPNKRIYKKTPPVEKLIRGSK